MILRDRYDGREAPFQGDRELYLRHLPADARIVSARATVTPVDLTDGREPFVETIRFQGNTGEWGATKARMAQADSIPGFVEVDFHARRTLAGVQGSGIGGAELQVDLGGAFVAVGGNGAVGVPDSSFALSGNSAPLPGLTVTRFRLTGADTPDVTSVRVRSLPSNVTLALRGRPSFWFHVGELITPQTTTDFVTVLAAYLPEAEVRDGYYLLPFVLHADGIARLEVELEIEYVRTASVLPNGLAEATLPFAFGSLPASSTVLALSLPGNAALARGGSVGRALGTFEGTRVAFGPTGEIGAEKSATVTPAVSLAQPVELAATVEAVAVDLLLGAVQREARLKIDLLEDLDGKPGGRSFWPAAVPFEITPETVAGGTAWVSVALPRPFQVKAGTPGWLVLQSVDGEAGWKILPAEAGSPSPGLQRTDDGGLSWRKAAVGDPQAALFRLRDQPKDFRTPIELQVGTGETARRVSLRRLDPQRRVELPFNLPEIEDAFEKALAEAAPSGCPRGEHLADGGFEQWVKVGDRLGAVQEFNQDIPSPNLVVVSPDGQRAYVVTFNNTLFAIDLGCGSTIGTVDVRSSVTAFAVHPGGTRAYAILSEDQLQVIDLENLRLVGSPLSFSFPMQSLAVSPDGRLLYLGFTSSGTVSSLNLPEGRGSIKVGANVASFDIVLLEEAALRVEPKLLDIVSRVASLGGNRDPISLVPSQDGARLWSLLRANQSTVNDSQEIVSGEVLALETPGLRVLHATSVPFNDDTFLEPFDLALTPDAATAVAVRESVVDLIDLGRRTIIASLKLGGRVVAIEPDGHRAFVAGGEDLHVIDLARRAEIEPPELQGTAFFSDVAVTPQGDRILTIVITDSEEREIHAIPIGTPAPAEWAVVSGRVAPDCLGDPARLVAVLGGLGDEAGATDSIVAQVVPIAPACDYELSFDGIALGEGAVAEILWRGEGCAAAGSVSIPIETLGSDDFKTQEERDNPPLRPHRLRLDPPAGATQAEIRFRVPVGGAAVTAASFQATDAVLAAGDFRPGAAGAPDPWTQTPAAVPGFTRLPGGTGSRLRNAGTRDVALAQAVSVTAGSAFTLEVRGRSRGPLRPVAAVALHWLAGDAPASAPAVTLEVPPGSFDGLAAAGTVPAGADRAELRVTVPPGVTLDVESVELRFPDFVTVPVNFLAEAPGELALLDWRIAWNERDLPPPPVPAAGLCPPSRPAPSVFGPASPKGDDGCCDPCGHGESAAWCPSCEAERPLEDAQPAITAAGRPAEVAACPACGARIVRPGGRLVAGAVAAGTPLPVFPAGPGSLSRSIAATRAARPVTLILGIGRARSRCLREAGLGTLEAVATSDPATLRRHLPGVTESAAGGFIAEARALLRSPG